MRFNIFVLIKGPDGGPYLVAFLEVPKMIQKVLQYVQGPQLSILEQLNTSKKPNKYIGKPRKSKISTKNRAVFWALLDPILGLVLIAY